MGRVFCVSGIDTGIGKTVMTGLMARSLLKRGVKVTTVKMVQTGNDGFSEDIDLHRQIMGVEKDAFDRAFVTAPQIFKYPSSPELAARLENRVIDLVAIEQAVKRCSEAFDVVLVELAGGLAVPLNDRLLSIDYAAQQKWRMILVTNGRLGSINPSLLSLEALHARHMPLAGVVYNEFPKAPPEIDADTPNAIVRWLRQNDERPVLVRVPEVKGVDYPDVDFSELFA